MQTPSVDTATEVRVQPSDVLMGRNFHVYNHPGNIRYRQIINSRHGAYHVLKSRLDKMLFIRQLANEILDDGRVRFVKFNKQTRKWTQIDLKAIQDKVSHALRDTKIAEDEDQQIYASLLHCKEPAGPSKGQPNFQELQEIKQPKQQEIDDSSFHVAGQKALIDLSLETGSASNLQLKERRNIRGVHQNASTNINTTIVSTSRSNLQLQNTIHQHQQQQELNNARLMKCAALQQWQVHMHMFSFFSALANKNNFRGDAVPIGPVSKLSQDSCS
eukprot:CAMPEP_0178915558 /NCGR_PEP_ID=MMETSP0786-20121207/12092_1 /TAXON_ID=186022 /ORGANISM="Thalassionema frauenfeldii, Strain CCMP 1798" /LENGTH=272 /DNA_ID=CAMNT_0020588679 /DNA_START=380 /DNA_END=1195 /DNA_ORIENTATION=+